MEKRAASYSTPERHETEPGQSLAYLGPDGTYTEQAAFVLQEQYPVRLPATSIAEIGRFIKDGTVTHGIVPIENSTAGPVKDTIELLPDGYQIIRELHLPISHTFYRRKDEDAVTTIASKDQGILQCGTFLQQYPNAEIVYTDSTAQAIQMAAEKPGWAAIGPSHTAKVLQVDHVLDQQNNVQDSDLNGTTFVVIQEATGEMPKPTGKDKTSIITTVPDREGILFEILDDLANRGINVSKIKSLQKQDDQISFFISVDGHQEDPENPAVAEALASLQEKYTMQNLGSYPKAEALYPPSNEGEAVDMATAAEKVKKEAQNGEFDPTNKAVAIFTVKHQPGKLVETLGVYRQRGINLSKIDSLPSGRVGEYIFYLAFENNLPQEEKEQLMTAVQEHCLQLVLVEHA